VGQKGTHLSLCFGNANLCSHFKVSDFKKIIWDAPHNSLIIIGNPKVVVPMNSCLLNIGVSFFVMDSNIKVHIIFKPITHHTSFGHRKK